jgi:hypothetical protein
VDVGSLNWGMLNDIKTEVTVSAITAILALILRLYNNHLDRVEAEYERKEYENEKLKEE